MASLATTWARPALVAGAFFTWVYISGDDPASYAPSWRLCATVLVTASTAVVGALYKFQDSLLYQPRALPQHLRPAQNPPGYRSPGEYDLPYDDVRLTTPDGVQLAAWMIRQDASRTSPTLIFFHANAGNMGFRLPNLVQLYRAARCNIFIVSYRGYGDSQGTPSEAGLMIDADTVVQHVLEERDDVDTGKVFLFGRSLGGAVAVYAAAKYDARIRGTVLENTFTNISDMVDAVFPVLALLKPYVLRIDWPSATRIASVTHPLLLVSGRRDEIVPSHQMDRLFHAASQSRAKELYEVPNGTHNDTWMKGGDGYTAKVRDFVAAHSS